MSVLLVIPAIAAFGAWDIFLNDGQLQPHLRFDSLFLPLYLLVFELPHIIASFFGFFQKEYVQHYKRHLVFGLPLFLLVFLILIGIDFYAAIVFYLVATLYHVVRQQTGIAHFFAVPKNLWHWLWAWFLIAGSASIYIIMQPAFVPMEYQPLLLILAQVALVLAAVTTIRLILQTKNSLGVLYVLATMAMAVVSYWMLMMGYEFLSVLVVRIVHDVTAFIFYITHEMNNNQSSINNVLYRHIPLLPWSLVIIVPLLAIIIGLTIRTLFTDPMVLLGVAMTVSFTHYYLECIMWKRGAIHREHIRVT